MIDLNLSNDLQIDKRFKFRLLMKAQCNWILAS